MSAPRLELDLVARRLRGGVAGVAVAVVGALCLATVMTRQYYLNEQRAGLEMRRAALAESRNRGRSAQTVAGLSAQNSAKTLQELGTPWSQLLAELENASGDTAGNVALLSVEPDHTKHRVRVTAEARTLALALGYVERLRKAQVLRYPMLDSHELRKDDKDHPVRFQVTAEWSDAS
jgi:hypothetical protein